MVILAWSMRYMLSSLQNPLPWVSCTNPWNTPNCQEFGSSEDKSGAVSKLTTTSSLFVIQNATHQDGMFPTDANKSAADSPATSPVVEYWQ